MPRETCSLTLTIHQGLSSKSTTLKLTKLQGAEEKQWFYSLKWGINPKQCWEWSETSAWTCSLLCCCMKMSPLHVTSTQGSIQNARCIALSCLLYPEICMKEDRMSDIWHTPIKFILYIFTEFKLLLLSSSGSSISN